MNEQNSPNLSEQMRRADEAARQAEYARWTKLLFRAALVLTTAIALDIYTRYRFDGANVELEKVKACVAAKGTWIADSCLLPSVVEMPAPEIGNGK